VTFDVFEEKGGSAGARFGGTAEAGFADAVGDFRNFEDWGDFFADAAELAGFVEEMDPVSEVVGGQGVWAPS
jgi:hypothetical protein